MLINELKKELSKHNNEEKDKIIIELYKKIPKNIKEDYDIDNFIINISNKTEKMEEKTMTIDELDKEIIFLMNCAKDYLYIKPNRIINKNERNNWRNKIKKLYKDLNTFAPDTKDGIKATSLLEELYFLLTYATNYLTFSSYNTFGALRVRQDEYLENVMSRKLILGVTKEIMESCVDLLDSYYDPNCYHILVLYSFISCLKTNDAKLLAIETLKNKIISKKEELKKYDIYEIKERINYFTECMFLIYIDLCEIEEGINNFKKFYLEQNKEILEYIIFDILEMESKYDWWIKEYEQNQEKINFRESIKEKYNNFKKGIYE